MDVLEKAQQKEKHVSAVGKLFSRTAKRIIIVTTTTIIKLILKGVEWHIVLITLHALTLSTPQPYKMGAVITLTL